MDSRSRRRRSALREFLQSETAGGLVLMAAAALGLAAANSPLARAYFDLLEAHLGPISVLHLVNDGLMTVFFLLVGLEIKREIVDGQLSTWSSRILPGVAAAAGMAVPALIYLAVNAGSPATQRGWATPAATDIAFALGVLALLGRRVPVSLKILVTSLAIIDDLGAVLIIAAFYTEHLALGWLAAAAAVLGLLIGLNRLKVRPLAAYLLPGGLMWFCVLQSGVHATIAGVALAFTIPCRSSPGRPDEPGSPLHKLEHALNPWVAFLVTPVFGFANAGVSLAGQTFENLLQPVTLGVAAGLFLGKQLGVFTACWAAIRLKLVDCPEDASLGQLYGVSILCGIGFTMSLFIGLLAFPGAPVLQEQAKLGVIVGSLLSGISGALVLALGKTPRARARLSAPRASDRNPAGRSER